MKRVLLGMSGGIDSTVAAVLLSQAGYKVIGVMLDLFSDMPFKPVCKQGDINRELFNDLKERFDIDFHLVNASYEFKKNIIDYFAKEYFEGRTPSPCVKCNIFIKFGLMVDLMETYNADYIATGHYAKIKKNGEQYYIQRAKNLKKDQSYFLFGVNKNLLDKIIFPIGDYDKEWTRTFAKQNNLKIHSRPDSQDICFVGNSDYRIFLKEFIEKDKSNLFSNIAKEGYLKTEDGVVVGKHLGYYNYTRSQRRKLGISYHKRMFVKDINPKTGDVILTDKKDDLLITEYTVKDINIFCKEFLDGKTELYIKDHGAGNGKLGTVQILDNTLHIKLKEPSYFVTAGQAAVIYKDDLLIAGGWIV